MGLGDGLHAHEVQPHGPHQEPELVGQRPAGHQRPETWKGLEAFSRLFRAFCRLSKAPSGSSEVIQSMPNLEAGQFFHRSPLLVGVEPQREPREHAGGLAVLPEALGALLEEERDHGPLRDPLFEAPEAHEGALAS